MQNPDEYQSDFKNKKFSTIKELKACIANEVKYHLENLMFGSEAKDITKFISEQMSEAILEDIYIEYFANKLWMEGVNFELAEKIESIYKKNPPKINDKHKINKATQEIADIIINKGNTKLDTGLATYTSRNQLGERFCDIISRDNSFLMECVNPDLYEKIYPVFWIEMLNRDPKDTYNFCKYLLEPINGRTDWEEYIFALLINQRIVDDHRSIFSLIKRKLVVRFGGENKFQEAYKNALFDRPNDDMDEFQEKYQRRLPTETELDELEKTLKMQWKNQILHKESFVHKREYMGKERYEIIKQIKEAKNRLKELEVDWKSVSEYHLEMQYEEDSLCFVEMLRTILQHEKTDGNRKQKVFENDLLTLKDLIEIGVDFDMNGLDPALFLYFLERLTGWLGFYFYANLKDSEGTYQPYSVSNTGTRIAMFYCWKKYIKEGNIDIDYTQAFHLRGWLLKSILNIYKDISDENRRLIYEEEMDCKIYHQLYIELFGENKKNEEFRDYMRIDALNYYHELFGDEEDIDLSF